MQTLKILNVVLPGRMSSQSEWGREIFNLSVSKLGIPYFYFFSCELCSCFCLCRVLKVNGFNDILFKSSTNCVVVGTARPFPACCAWIVVTEGSWGVEVSLRAHPLPWTPSVVHPRAPRTHPHFSCMGHWVGWCFQDG